MAGPEVDALLGWLASDRHVAATTHRLRKTFFARSVSTAMLLRSLPTMEAPSRWSAAHESFRRYLPWDFWRQRCAWALDPNIGLAAQSNAAIGERMQTLVAGAPVVVLAVMAGGLPTAARVLRERRRSRGRG